MFTGDRNAEEFHYADVVAATDGGEKLLKLLGLEFATEFALEDDDVSVP